MAALHACSRLVRDFTRNYGSRNIYLNGAILGMTRAEIMRRFDEIVEFSGIGEFLVIHP